MLFGVLDLSAGTTSVKGIFLTSVLLAVATSILYSNWIYVRPEQTITMTSEAENVYAFSYTDIDGAEQSMKRYDGKVLIVVNVATNCGYTKGHYEQLQELYDSYKDKGLSILGFPCNQFLGQEPGTEAEIKEAVCSRFKATFDMAKKIDVNGSGTHPLWVHMKSKQGGFLLDAIKWNFTKFLIDKQGNVIRRYGPSTNPKDIESEIQKLLEQ